MVGQFEYDVHGIRTKKVESGVETRFLLDGNSVLAELDASNAPTRHYLLNPEQIDDIFAFQDGAAEYFPLTDALGSVAAVVDSAGGVVSRYSYEVYGAGRSGPGPTLAVGFTGREHDAWGGVHHRDRTRKPTTGGWLQSDRVGLADGQILTPTDTRLRVLEETPPDKCSESKASSPRGPGSPRSSPGDQLIAS